MAAIKNRANPPLKPFQKFIAFMFPLMFLSGYLLNPYWFPPKECKRRNEEMWLWIFIGILFWVLLTFILVGFISTSG